MNVIRKEKPIGLDFKIDELQKQLDKGLCKKNFGLDIYPRCYILEHENGRSIEHYKGNNEYGGNLIVSEENKIFFLADKPREQIDNIRFRTNVSLFGVINLQDVDFNNYERFDEEILSDLADIVMSSGVENLNIITNFYEIFDVTYFKDSSRNFAVNNDNIQPYFYFRIDFGIIYELKQNC